MWAGQLSNVRACVGNVCFVNRANPKQSHASGTVSPVLWGLSTLGCHFSLAPSAGNQHQDTCRSFFYGNTSLLPPGFSFTTVYIPLGHIACFGLQLLNVPMEPTCIFFGRTKFSALWYSPAEPWRCWYSMKVCKINKHMKNGQLITQQNYF